MVSLVGLVGRQAVGARERVWFENDHRRAVADATRRCLDPGSVGLRIIGSTGRVETAITVRNRVEDHHRQGAGLDNRGHAIADLRFRIGRPVAEPVSRWLVAEALHQGGIFGTRLRPLDGLAMPVGIGIDVEGHSVAIEQARRRSSWSRPGHRVAGDRSEQQESQEQ